MEIQQQPVSSSPGKSTMSTASSASAFRLEDQSARWGAKLWTLVFDLPGEKVNKLSRRVMEEFDALLPKLEELGKAGNIDALVLLSGKPGNFIAGADIELIQAARTAQEAESLSRMGQKLLNRWEELPFPTVAAVNGAALGGGCEFSLASTAIAISNDPAARIGLPEVMLGVIPGMGGCVRLPRKVGLATALDMILTGKTLTGDRAYKGGLADALIQKEAFETGVLAWTSANLKALRSGVRLAKEPKLGGMGGAVGTVMEKTPVGRMVIFRKAREGVLEKTKGQYPAPLEAIDVLQATGAAYGPRVRGGERERAMEREAQGFGKCAATEVSKNLIRLFFLTEAVKKSKGLPSGATAAARKVRRGAVLGAGVMGGGIAQLLADKGIPARMKDINGQALSAGMTAASRIFAKGVQRRKLTSREYLQKMNLIAPVLDFSGFPTADLVVEAIVEKMDVKKKVFQELEGHVGEDCVIVSNTSSLSISEMQTALKRPERFAGMHFFNPVHRMPLVEVIRGAKSSDEAVTTVFQFSKQLGKTPIVVKDSPGFLVNRLLMPYLNEATWLLADGVPIPEIDAALVEFGMPMGPMELIDEVGVDVGEKVSHILHDAFGARMQPAPFNAKIVAAGRLGKKNGKGLYVYDDKGRNKELDEKIYETLGVNPVEEAVAREEIVERCILPMINEASRCLEEGVVATAAEVDLGMIMGTGFPPFRGGLLRYADTLGAKTVVDRLKKYEARYGARYEPAPALLNRAKNGQTFY
jgi:3-hydroxyacyl-CoA dehydrogenase/enoyl-CoA hydratase/3-hydroxybutyryl-CoA epimerase